MNAATRMRSKGGKARALLSKEILSEIGRKGGLARSEKLSSEERSAAARKAVTVRWDRERAKVRKKKKK